MRGGRSGGDGTRTLRCGSFRSAITWPSVSMSTEVAGAGAIVAAPIIQATASGHGFWWSGADGPCSGQQGIPSGMDIECAPFIEPCDIANTATSARDATMGAINRPAIARIENSREQNEKSFTDKLSHISQGLERGHIPPSRCLFARRRVAIKHTSRSARSSPCTSSVLAKRGERLCVFFGTWRRSLN